MNEEIDNTQEQIPEQYDYTVVFHAVLGNAASLVSTSVIASNEADAVVMAAKNIQSFLQLRPAEVKRGGKIG